jgi:hypothetical protein
MVSDYVHFGINLYNMSIDVARCHNSDGIHAKSVGPIGYDHAGTPCIQTRDSSTRGGRVQRASEECRSHWL